MTHRPYMILGRIVHELRKPIILQLWLPMLTHPYANSLGDVRTKPSLITLR